MTLEGSIERRLTDWCRANKILCLKLKLVVGRGWPDRTVLRNGRVLFLELKRSSGGRTSPQQRFWVNVLTKHGFSIHVVNSFDEAVKLIGEMK